MHMPHCRRLTIVACSLAVLASACGHGQSNDTITVEASAGFLAASADRTLAAHTGTFEVTMSIADVAAGSGTMTITGNGAYDIDAGRTAMAFDLSALAGAAGSDVPAELAHVFDQPIREVVDGTTMYLDFPFLSALLGSGGKEWISVDLSAAAGGANLLGAGSGGLSQDPSTMLQFLQGASDDIAEVGSEDVRGVATTHLRGTFTLQAAIDNTSPEVRKKIGAAVNGLDAGSFLQTPIPLDVYVDGDGFVRRFGMVMTVPDTPGSLSLQVDYFDFGKAVTIEVPASDDVTDVTGQLSNLGSG